eukprot:CAMPEP_0172933938 /NCGR_PEP_ID=MMETSP1075-20121228/220759_1 /TAXON_ID=2916 /ORGANISM="Ceratium fusus, Strain PA161109" /LENGTH=153 /DNA_ID=CAMNT_0013795285 /DNA_START=362 /DNA_END=820 /DNA_ORIENTATION=+
MQVGSWQTPVFIRIGHGLVRDVHIGYVPTCPFGFWSATPIPLGPRYSTGPRPVARGLPSHSPSVLLGLPRHFLNSQGGCPSATAKVIQESVQTIIQEGPNLALFMRIRAGWVLADTCVHQNWAWLGSGRSHRPCAKSHIALRAHRPRASLLRF